MARRLIARVVDHQLTQFAVSGGELATITVGTSSWYDWLHTGEAQSFAYHTSWGGLTARRELRHGSWYWYGYRARNGKLCKGDLGKAEELAQQPWGEAIRKLRRGQRLGGP